MKSTDPETQIPRTYSTQIGTADELKARYEKAEGSLQAGRNMFTRENA